uniref:Uncharacterized protein n=1 Tax=Triticum urartu TaxID=4572 RepID=A0A8R7THR9_TRIUA
MFVCFFAGEVFDVVLTCANALILLLSYKHMVPGATVRATAMCTYLFNDLSCTPLPASCAWQQSWARACDRPSWPPEASPAGFAFACACAALAPILWIRGSSAAAAA